MSQNRYDLSNHDLRAKALEHYFEATGIRSDFARIANHGDWFELELANRDADDSSFEFQQLLSKLNKTCDTQLRSHHLYLRQTLTDVIALATTDNVFNKTAANSLLGACFDFDSIAFDIVTGRFTVNMPSPAIANLFITLRHPHLHASNEQLGINLYEYISECAPAIFLMHRGPGHQVSILLNNQFFPKQKLLIKQEPQEDGSIKVTPYMFVSQPDTPANYHFILDHSPSMDGTRLDTAKSSIVNFATILFQFEPRARLFIHKFNDIYSELRATPFLLSDLNNGNLKYMVERIHPGGGTNIARACRAKIREFANNQNNVMLFTDGEDDTSEHTALQTELDGLSEEQKIRNKFFIISFVRQPNVLQNVTTAFGSQLFVEQSTHLQEVLANHDQLQTWAASRELFTTRVQILQNINGETTTHVYTAGMHQSNQLEALPSFSVQSGDEVSIEVMDSNNQTLLTTRQIIRGTTPLAAIKADRPRSPNENSIFHHNQSELQQLDEAALIQPGKEEVRSQSPSPI